MDDPAFRHWLTLKSWDLGVRYCKAVLWLLPVAALAMDLPLLLSHDQRQAAKLPWLAAWQASVLLTSAGVVAVDRWLPAQRGRETVLSVFCGAFMLLVTWVGVASFWMGGTGIAIYAAGSTFMAAVICTARPVRRPMYALSLVALGTTTWMKGGDATAVVLSLINPFCVVMLCLGLDKFTWTRNLELYRERRRVQEEMARADEVLANVLPARIAEALKRDGRVRAEKFGNLGVLFADIVGFTSYASRMPPDALVLVLDGIFSAFDGLIDRHGAEKIKTIGDAYMVVAPDGAQRLCALALDMQQAMDRYNRANGTDLSIRIGIHAGPAVAGVVGAKRFLYDVWGDTVNIASRIESTGRPGAVHVSQAVLAQAGAGFAFTDRGLVDLQGRGRMRTAWLGQAGDGAAMPSEVAQAA